MLLKAMTIVNWACIMLLFNQRVKPNERRAVATIERTTGNYLINLFNKRVIPKKGGAEIVLQKKQANKWVDDSASFMVDVMIQTSMIPDDGQEEYMEKSSEIIMKILEDRKNKEE